MQFSGVVFSENLSACVLQGEGPSTLVVQRLRNSVYFSPQSAEFFASWPCTGLRGHVVGLAAYAEPVHMHRVLLCAWKDARRFVNKMASLASGSR